MIKSALEKIICEDMGDIWQLLDGNEKRLIIENFEVHNFKKTRLYMPRGTPPSIFGYCSRAKSRSIRTASEAVYRY